MSAANTPHILHIRIDRLVVDAAALGNLPREQLMAQVQSALVHRLSGTTTPVKPKGLAEHIADHSVPQIERQLPTRTASRGGNGTL
jgi:hypothetical protein